MAISRITSRDDPRIAPYLNLKDRELAREGDRFIVEGEQVVRRLLASRFETESILIADRRLAEMLPVVPEHVELLVAPADIVNSILGFRFHSGVMACGRRGTPPAIDDMMATAAVRATVAIVEDVNNSENLGSLIRIAAGFGVDAMILGERCADPFFRRSIRVSMGTVFYLPIVRSTNLAADIGSLRQRWGVEIIATILSADAEPLATAKRGNRIALCFGSESHGLSAPLIAACDRRITIPMRRGNRFAQCVGCRRDCPLPLRRLRQLKSDLPPRPVIWERARVRRIRERTTSEFALRLAGPPVRAAGGNRRTRGPHGGPALNK